MGSQMGQELGLGASSAVALTTPVAPMESWLDDHAGRDRSPTFAYPCDVTNLGSGTPTLQANRYARLLAHAGIASARTSEGEPNRPETTLRRPHRLQALAVGYDAGDASAALDYLKLAVHHGHWAILIFHEIVPIIVEAGQVSTAMHEQVLDAIAFVVRSGRPRLGPDR